jgi:hypothetical protein
MLNLTRSLGELAAHQSAEMDPMPHSTGSDRPPIGPARRSKTETKIEGETIETLRDINSQFQAKIDGLSGADPLLAGSRLGSRAFWVVGDRGK